jgi:hypothetical protein
MEEIQKEVFRFLAEYGFRIIGAIIILVADGLGARWLGRVVRQGLEKNQIEPPSIILTVRVQRCSSSLSQSCWRWTNAAC